VDYLSYAEGLARVRAYHARVKEDRSGAVEAYVALPARDYCELAGNLQKDSRASRQRTK
jgi:hypothetical protein